MSGYRFPIEFRERAQKALKDARLRETLREVMPHFREERVKKISEVPDWEMRRDRASQIKEEVIRKWEEYHRLADEALKKRGIKVFHARDGKEARKIIGKIAKGHHVKKIVKSKSMVSEEIELDSYLEGLGMEVTETDLGEFIIQLAGEKPFHIIAPAVHKKAREISRLFQKKLGLDVGEGIIDITDAARKVLKKRFLEADMGITGSNFVVAETGTLAIVENEGNARMCVAYPRVHVAIVGEEKLLPRFTDLGLFLPLLTISATGQRMTSYVMLLGSPYEKKINNPKERYVIFLDNGRSKILKDRELWPLLKCIRCGACINVCPIYNKIGGYAYGWVYSGPIGAVFNYGILGPERAGELPFASTLCGACDNVCPVKIPITKILLEERRRSSELFRKARGRPGFAERAIFSLWSYLMSHPGLYGLFSTPIRKILRFFGFGSWRRHHLPPFRQWSRERDFPPLSKETFLSHLKKKGE